MIIIGALLEMAGKKAQADRAGSKGGQTLTTIADCNSLILGTAQLGMAYGIANRVGQPGQREAKKIVETALDEGISHFDTAQDYGESEALLGIILNELDAAGKVKITTKLHPDINLLNEKEVIRAVESSMRKLKNPQLYCLMLHRERYLDLLEKGLNVILEKIIGDGYAKHIGISVYSPAAAFAALKALPIDIVQLPANLLDRRFEKSGVFRVAAASGKLIHIRSVFLQGLLLMEAKDVPATMSFTLPVIRRLEEIARETHLTRNALALHYVKIKYPSSNIIFGAESPAQVCENCKIWGSDVANDLIEKIENAFPAVEERILNPTLWY